MIAAKCISHHGRDHNAALDDDAELFQRFNTYIFPEGMQRSVILDQQIAQQNGLAETIVEISQSRFRAAVVAALLDESAPVLIELHKTHFEER
ncbi:hypothetical protein D3C87_1880100 [compost metagenome]